jgi:predicted lipoprotein with Yx(FWY)xxD motif
VKRAIRVYSALGAAAAVIGLGYVWEHSRAISHATETAATLVTPQGVTLQPLGKAQGYDLGKSTASAIARDQIAYADTRGRTLYTWDQDPAGKSTCVDACAASFQPFLATSTGTTLGDWSLLSRGDGTKQWALKGKALYTYVKDVDPGSVRGDSPANSGALRKNGLGVMVGGGYRGEFHSDKPAADPFPGGWKPALLYPLSAIKLPAGVAVKEIPDAAAFAFVDHGGYTLYEFIGGESSDAEKCAPTSCKNWRPFPAAQLAEPIGDFTVVDRSDGIRQWAYKNRLLYTYVEDLAPGYANGVGVDGRWDIAAVMRYYMPPSVSIQRTPGQGSVLATAGGMTLYRRDGYILQSGGGHSLRRGQPPRPAVGRDIGTDPRCANDCGKVWHPFLAPANAQPWGFWDVATRTDGSKQWVYQGYALWTYDGDKKPGDMTGHDTYDIFVSDEPTRIADVGTPMDGGASLWWSIALP